MKGLKIDATSTAIGAACGLVVGALTSLACSRRRFNTRLDSEVAEVKRHYEEKQASDKAEWADIAEELKLFEEFKAGLPTSRLDVRPENNEDGREDDGESMDSDDDDSYGDPYPGDEDQVRPEHVIPAWTAADTLDTPPIARDVTKPYAISVEEFGEREDHTNLTITFYAADGVLADDKDAPINDIIGTVGELNPLSFGGISEDPHIRFVRNEHLQIDFEIILNVGSFSEVILGYGQPNPS